MKDEILTQVLIDNGADVNATDDYGQSALHFARSSAVAKVLIDNGADVNLKNQD
jgi:uncharacterized protein